MVSSTGNSTRAAFPNNPYGAFDGIGGQNSSIRLRDITDGTSQTFVFGERAWILQGTEMGAGTAVGFSGAVSNRTADGLAEGATAVLGISYWGMNDTFSPFSGHTARAFSSPHSGGIQFALCDGSVRFISENIDFKPHSVGDGWFVDSTLERLFSRNDGQPIGEF